MHIGIDVREAGKSNRTGKGMWTHFFVQELLTRDVALTLYTDTDISTQWGVLDNAKHRVVKIPGRGLKWHLRAARHIADSNIDAYVSTVSYIVPALLGRTKKIITIVHDLIAFRSEPHDRKATMIERLTLGRAARTAALICTVSDTTKQDLITRYPQLDAQKIVPIYAASVIQNTNEKKTDDHILCIATLSPRKNQLNLIRAYSLLSPELRQRYPLILVGGRGWNDEEIIHLAQQTQGVTWKKYVPDAECHDLLMHAAVFALPSLYEGFGMPILDAFIAGVPVLTSDRGSLKEVAGNAALLVNPESVESIAKGLTELLTNADVRTKLTQAGFMQKERFSWKNTVDLFLAALRKIDN